MLQRLPPYFFLKKIKEDPTAEMLQTNYKYGHTSFNLLQPIVTNGVLTKLLDDFPFTVCTDCPYGKATKFPRKTNTTQFFNDYKLVTSFFDCVSVDLLVPSTTGFVAHIYSFIMCHSCQYE